MTTTEPPPPRPASPYDVLENLPTLNDLLLASARKLQQPGISSDTLASPAASSYLSRLTSLPLSSLLEEPERLRDFSISLDSDLSTLCFREYGTFLLAHEASSAISTSFSRLARSLDGILNATSALDAAAHAFPSRSGRVLKERQEMGVVLEHLGRVEELLDVPRLVATCVRTGNWNEAMDLGSRIRDLEGRSQGSSVIKTVREEVDEALRGLRTRVLEGLRERSLKLLGAVRSVQILRRMAGTGSGLSEPELRMAFLTSRWECLRASLQQLQLASGLVLTTGLRLSDELTAQAGEERSRFVRKWAETWRELVSEAVSMYSELFLDGRPSSQRTIAANVASAQDATQLTLVDALAPLTAFASHARNTLLAFLDVHTPHLTSVASLASVLTQLAYCAVAFGKWGFDFRADAAEIIVARAGQLVERRMREGYEYFKAEMASGQRKPVDSWLVAQDSLSQILAAPVPTTDSSGQPHPFLVNLPPLTRFVNAQLTALNELRLLPAIDLYESLSTAQALMLSDATSLVLELAASKPTAETVQVEEEPQRLQREGVLTATAAWSRLVLPVLSTGLHKGIYGRKGEVSGLVQKCEDEVRRLSRVPITSSADTSE